MAKRDRRQIQESVQELVDAIATEQTAALARFAPGFRIMSWFTDKLEAAFRAYAPEGSEKLGSEFEFKSTLVHLLRRDLVVMQEGFFRKSPEYIRSKFANTASQLDKELQARWTKHLEAVRLHGVQNIGYNLDVAGELYRGAFKLWEELQVEQARLNANREKKRLDREEKQRLEALKRHKEEQERLAAQKLAEEAERDRVRREKRHQEVRDFRARVGLTAMVYETDVAS